MCIENLSNRWKKTIWSYQWNSLNNYLWNLIMHMFVFVGTLERCSMWCCIFPCVKLRIPRLVFSLFGIVGILNSFGRTLTLLYCKNFSLRRNGKKNEKLLLYICFVLFGNEEIKCLLIIYHINSLNPFLCVIFLEWVIKNRIKILFLRIYR